MHRVGENNVGSLRYVKIDVSPPIFFHVIYVVYFANVIGEKVIKRFTHFEIVNLFGQIPSPYSFLCIGLVRIMSEVYGMSK